MTAGRTAAGRNVIAMLLAAGCMAGCSSEPPPFEAKYLSPDQVLVVYQDRKHVLNRHGGAAPVPFTYRFEEDGDLDLLIDGRSYEVDSPYDRDRSRKKIKTARQKVAAPQKSAPARKSVSAGKSGTSSQAAKARR
jgi:hypothetical protein